MSTFSEQLNNSKMQKALGYLDGSNDKKSSATNTAYLDGYAEGLADYRKAKKAEKQLNDNVRKVTQKPYSK